MLSRLAIPTVLLLLCGCPADPTGDPPAEASAAGLEDDALKALLQETAGVDTASWSTCVTSISKVELRLFEQETLTALLLFGPPSNAEVKAPGFVYLREHPPTPYEARPSVERCKDAGYVSALLAQDVTKLEVTWAANEAQGTVEWTAPEFWTGRASFLLQRTETGWEVQRFDVEGAGTVERIDGNWWVTEPKLVRMPDENAPPQATAPVQAPDGADDAKQGGE